MNDLRLKAGVKFAVAGIPYTDPKSGFKVDAYERGVDGAIQMLIDHRRANERLFDPAEGQWFSPALVKQELLRHFQEKAPHLLAGAPIPTVTRTATGFPEKCVCGGTEFEPHHCPTCGGSRISGYKCTACGKLFGL